MGNEQWLSDGNCEICRRENYCSKPCKQVKVNNARFIRNCSHKAISKVFNGSMSSLEEKVHETVNID